MNENQGGVNAAKYDVNMQRAISDGIWDFRRPEDGPFSINGLLAFGPEKLYRRLPSGTRASLPEAVDLLANCPAGGQIRFRTNATRLAIRVQMAGAATMDHMPVTGQCGLDAYIGKPGQQRYAATARPGIDGREYEHILWDVTEDAKGQTAEGNPFLSGEMVDVTLNLPLYQGVHQVLIGVKKEAVVKAPTAYATDRRILLYGTSITQGACASRPGLMYSNILSRRIPLEFINLGFSGSGKGEAEVALAIRDIERPACLILDYEANCTTELYQETLEPFIRLYREYHPDIPIIVISRIPYPGELFQPARRAEWLNRKKIAEACVARLISLGDRMIDFVDGSRLLGPYWQDCTVDGTHPNDLGFMNMADKLEPILRKVLQKNGVL
ncbi:lysophospholipase L1-like esterase [Scopulibacillus darangshiensis]|uniref:Lysophospholipase L1-like esterase n=1 Tax=Scopulibacillus darangshiensis TaxID=442528 RepID=A0A4R2NL12_9BACL|nr:SGNH/GDSL hydrolase family protein [Scopulibacillus darangshiensis]TCP21874.1 lysophospholipase L1-like esterase [Scopulibacillus darangshiensis]